MEVAKRQKRLYDTKIEGVVEFIHTYLLNLGKGFWRWSSLGSYQYIQSRKLIIVLNF